MFYTVKKGLTEEVIFKLSWKNECDRAKWKTKWLGWERGIASSNVPQDIASCALHPSKASQRGAEESGHKSSRGHSFPQKLFAENLYNK